MLSPIKLTTQEKGNHIIIHVAGSMTAKNIIEIRAAFEQASKRFSQIAVELSGIDYMDSMGVGILVNMDRKLKGQDGRLLIISPSEGVREILELSDVDRLIPILPDASDLLSAFA